MQRGRKWPFLETSTTYSHHVTPCLTTTVCTSMTILGGISAGSSGWIKLSCRNDVECLRLALPPIREPWASGGALSYLSTLGGNSGLPTGRTNSHQYQFNLLHASSASRLALSQKNLLSMGTFLQARTQSGRKNSVSSSHVCLLSQHLINHYSLYDEAELWSIFSHCVQAP